MSIIERIQVEAEQFMDTFLYPPERIDLSPEIYYELEKSFRVMATEEFKPAAIKRINISTGPLDIRIAPAPSWKNRARLHGGSADWYDFDFPIERETPMTRTLPLRWFVPNNAFSSELFRYLDIMDEVKENGSHMSKYYQAETEAKAILSRILRDLNTVHINLNDLSDKDSWTVTLPPSPSASRPILLGTTGFGYVAGGKTSK